MSEIRRQWPTGAASSRLGDPAAGTGSVDDTILAFVAAHDLVITSQLRRVADESAEESARRVERLVSHGLIERAPRFAFQHGAFQITAAGLERLGSDLQLPVLDLRRYWHRLGLAWLWVHAHVGSFGELDAIYSRREMKRADERVTTGLSSRARLLSLALRVKLADAKFAIDLPNERSRLPGIVLVLPQGRVAMDFILTEPSQRWLDAVLDGYAVSSHLAVAVLFATTIPLRDALQAKIDRRGLSDRVRAQQGRFVHTSP